MFSKGFFLDCMQKVILYTFFILTLCVSPYTLNAQFYNGTQMSFGKNRVAYKEAYWRFLRYQDFDVFYNTEGRSLADFASRNIPIITKELETLLDISYPRRIIFIVCNSLEDLKQTNIGLSTSDNNYNIGGITQIIGNKVTIFNTGNKNDLLQQIRKGITELYINEFLFGAENYREIVSNSTLSEYPDWYVFGLIEYLANSNNTVIHAHIPHIIESGMYRNMTKLYGEEAQHTGYLFWKYIGETYGIDKISNILYVSGIMRDITSGFELILGKSFEQLMQEMHSYYTKQNQNKEVQQHRGTIINIPKRITKQKITHLAISPNNTHLAFVSNNRGQLRVRIHHIPSGKTKSIHKVGHTIEQITDNTFPSLAWHPSGKIVSYFYESKGSVFFNMYVLETEEIIQREFHGYDKITDIQYSNDGFKIVYTGVRRGQADIYVYDIPNFRTTQITNSFSDDITPSFIYNDTKIIFSSNRTSAENTRASQTLSENFNLFIAEHITQNASIRQLTESSAHTNIMPTELSKGSYIYVSQHKGFSSLHYVQPDSVILSIDTTVHYRYFTNQYQLAFTPVSIREYAINKDILAFTQIQKGRNQILTLPVSVALEHKQTIPTEDLNAETHIQKQRSNPSLQNKQINYRDYEFEFEIHPHNIYIDSVYFDDFIPTTYKIAQVYETNFYINQVVNQIDFGYVSSSYQPFTGRDFQYIPQLNISLRFGVIDLFEDYRLTGGVRFFGDFYSNEFLFSLENLKQRWNKQYIFHRQSIIRFSEHISFTVNRAFDHTLLARYTFPFNEVASVRITPSIRYILDSELAIDHSSLLTNPVSEYWSGIKIEYVFDNIVPRGLNIYNGIRLKVFAETYTNITDNIPYLFVTGLDARNYQKIHRNIIFASRLAYSYSQGTAPLLYYLGGVDNWINLSVTQAKFDRSIQYDQTVEWRYQAIGTNLRGFPQNIRNGPSFAVLNNEIRVPIIQYIMHRPLKSDFLTNLQIVGFVDAGAAWYGLYPGAEENAYNYTIYYFGQTDRPHTVKIDEMRSPFVYGYGYGFRSRLFGYFLRLDWAKGHDGNKKTSIFYLSLSLDF